MPVTMVDVRAHTSVYCGGLRRPGSTFPMTLGEARRQAQLGNVELLDAPAAKADTKAKASGNGDGKPDDKDPEAA